jgi:antitoxin component HigA of HigAB toxin-antitoxin module
MKATLFVVENDADLTQAKALIEKLMGSNDPANLARMTAQARLVEAYERARWPRRAPSLPDLLTYLMDQYGLSRADLVPLLGTPTDLGGFVDLANATSWISCIAGAPSGKRVRVSDEARIGFNAFVIGA